MQAPLPRPELFKSFWLAGFEAASHRTCEGNRIDMIAVTQHDRQVERDYANLRRMGIQGARDGIRWHLVDRGGEYDFSSFLPMLTAARRHGIQVIWSLCHYGWPDDVDVFSAAFVERFARYAGAVARVVAETGDEVPFYTPINELSFLSWGAAEAGFIHPCVHGRGVELKNQLIRATIAACDAIWEVDPRARIVHVDPTIQVIAPPGRPDLARFAAVHTFSQFDAWDILGGWECAELGGHPRYLDIVGVNYYHDNQWELERPRISWEERVASGDKRWLPFHAMLEAIYTRYQRPIFVGETSHFGIGRGPWIELIAEEVIKAREIGVPVEGVCLYPIVDRPDWHDHGHWHNSGLWDVDHLDNGELRRVINPAYEVGLRVAQTRLALHGCGEPPLEPFDELTPADVEEELLASAAARGEQTLPAMSSVPPRSNLPGAGLGA